MRRLPPLPELLSFEAVAKASDPDVLAFVDWLQAQAKATLESRALRIA